MIGSIVVLGKPAVILSISKVMVEKSNDFSKVM